MLEGRRAAALRLDGNRRCAGLDTDDGQEHAARAVVLATGGAAALWSRTTNPPGSFGSGLLLARAAGATLADLEFVQFHPTAVTGVAGREGFLVSEAVRGEGATLHDGDGERFVDELAPRDHVARAIRTVWTRRGEPCVYLDMRAVDPGRFPNVVEALREAGLDPMLELVPVAPAAHYVMGGIATDLEGRTRVGGLYAVGECACTGLHGANRLASNSLSECFVFGYRAAGPGWRARRRARLGARPADVQPPARETREAVWRDAGLERDPAACGGCSRTRPARPTRGRLGARAGGEPRRAPPGRPFRARSCPGRVSLRHRRAERRGHSRGVGLTRRRS